MHKNTLKMKMHKSTTYSANLHIDELSTLLMPGCQPG